MSKKTKKNRAETAEKEKNITPFGEADDDTEIIDPETLPEKKKKTTKKKSKKRGKKNNQYCWWAAPLAAACILIIGFIALYSINTVFEYDDFKTRKASLSAETFYTGVLVENYDLSGKTMDEALAYWEKWIEKPLKETSIVIEVNGEAQCFSCEELGYESDYESVLLNAWASGREGSFEERYRSMRQIRSTASRSEVTRKLFDADILRAYTDAIAAENTVDAINAQILDFDFETHGFTLGESHFGTYVDADALFEQAKYMLENGGGRLVVNVEMIEPEVRTDDITGSFGMITQALTNASSSSSNRLSNLRLACEAINGTILMPGETFSYNDTVGERTKAKGYKLAGVFSSGELAEDIGGGVCQVSTTLWNAAMKANCENVERHEHSRPVTYVDKGKDATVSWTSQDMKFKNTSDYPMYIVAYLGENKRVYCEIYGKLLDDGMYIKIEAKTTKKIDPPEPVYVLNPSLGKGNKQEVSEARTGYKASAYRVYYSKDGTELSRVLLCTSYYREAAAKIEYGG